MKRHSAVTALLLSLALNAQALDMNLGRAVPAVPVTGPIKAETLPALPAAALVPGAPIIGAQLETPALDAVPQLAIPANAAQSSPAGTAVTASMPELRSASTQLDQAAPEGGTQGYTAGVQAFDGVRPAAAIESGDGGRVLEPAFEPAAFYNPPSNGGGDGGGRKGGNGGNGGDNSDGNNGEMPRRPALSFSNPSARTALLAIDPAKSIYGSIKRLRGDGSKDYWGVYKKGAEIDVVIRGESVFGQPTIVTAAFNKPIGKLNRDDLKGLVPEYQLKAPIKQLRQLFLDRLEEDRKTWHANDEPVSGKTLVRIIKFKSYIELYKEKHGSEAQPEPEAPKTREPLQLKAEGPLKRLTYLLPRAVFLDMDLFDGPVSQDFLGDMIKLQRTGVYFVAFSRKPYGAAGSLREKLIHQMSSYQLSILMPNRFMAVTDDGAVISGFPKGGNVVPRDVVSFSPSAIDVLRDAAQKASEASGLSPKAAVEIAQPGIKEAVDEFPGLTRRESRSQDPRVRFEIAFAKSVSRAEADSWKVNFERSLQAHALQAQAALVESPEGRLSLVAQRTNLESSFERVKETLGTEFGLYLNPNDILVLSSDPKLKTANPDLDFERLSGLKGKAMAENALGLMLGEHRENMDGDRAGSASRISSFRRDRHQYMSEILIKQDLAEQNVNFFSGHVVHSVNDWVVHQLQIGKRPTEAEYRAELQRRWDVGTKEFKAIGMPAGETVDGMLRESMQRGVSMYKMIVAAADRKEILVGTEIAFEFPIHKYQKRTEALKGRYFLHGQFDFVAIRPNPAKPGHGMVVIYDFKTGPAQSRQKLDKDIQVQLYTYFARHHWQGQDFPVPYLSGKETIRVDEVKVEFIYNAVKQPTTVTNQDMDKTRATIIRTLDRIAKTEAQLLGDIVEKPAKKAKPAKKPAKKTAKAAKASPKSKS